jgi:hypothetical protein
LVKNYWLGYSSGQFRGLAGNCYIFNCYFRQSGYNKKTTTGYAILAVILIIFFIVARLKGDAPGSEAWDKLTNKK